MSNELSTKEQGMPAIVKEFPLTPTDGDGPDMMSLVRDNLGEDTLSPFDLERITIPPQGATTWQLEDSETKSIEGVIIKWQKSRSYWAEAISGQGTPPDCISVDMLYGHYSDEDGAPVTQECITCPMNQFGTGVNGTGKACKEAQHVFLLRHGSILPSVLQVSPSNLKGFTKYRARLTGKRKSVNSVVTEFTLRKQTSKSGFSYSEVVYKDAADLSAEQYQMIQEFRQQLDKIVNADSADTFDE